MIPKTYIPKIEDIFYVVTEVNTNLLSEGIATCCIEELYKDDGMVKARYLVKTEQQEDVDDLNDYYIGGLAFEDIFLTLEEAKNYKIEELMKRYNKLVDELDDLKWKILDFRSEQQEEEIENMDA